MWPETIMILAAALLSCLSSSSSASGSPLQSPLHHAAGRSMGTAQQREGCDERTTRRYDEGATSVSLGGERDG